MQTGNISHFCQIMLLCSAPLGNVKDVSVPVQDPASSPMEFVSAATLKLSQTDELLTTKGSGSIRSGCTRHDTDPMLLSQPNGDGTQLVAW